MDAALGPPESMVEVDEELTPMIRQYVDLCAEYDDCLVLFHVGDFYKVFCDAAETVSRLCELTLASREDSTGEYPMTGIRVDKAEAYIEKLLDAGYRVAVAEQVEDPESVDGVADRQVTRVITPGTLTEDELLDDAHNFVACVTREATADHARDRFGLALLDVSTGDFYATTVEGAGALRDEASRFDPAEVVLGPEIPEGLVDDTFDLECVRTPFEPPAFDPATAREHVTRYFGAPEAQLVTDAEVRACGGLLAYAEYARGGADPSDDEGDRPRLDYLNHLTRYDPREYVLLDAVALRSLELFERRAVRSVEGASLAEVVDETASALGSRELTDWLRRPLLDQDRIEARHDAVGELVSAVQAREQLHDLLRDVYDIERLISRVARGRADARDLRSLKSTLDVVPDLRAALADAESELLLDLRVDLDPLVEVRERIDTAVVPDPPVELTEGGLIREGYNDRLDDLRATKREAKQWIANLQARERERTGIDTLEVGHTEVHGYYIEVTDAKVPKVPEEYTRRQTLKNAERFYTPDLKQREDEIFRAAARADDLEYKLFREVRADVAADSERVQGVAAAVATLDALVALATVAAEHRYCRPEMGADGFHVEAGRHPVVERTQSSFVPNDTHLERGEVAVVTGPNMSGKSTYMRQVALISILAQAGGFVPATAAELPIVDRVFTRVGASDDIAGGQSTFMVEMTELAEILRSSTEDSLVLLDEVGRGTSTSDGFAIARAVTEHLHDKVGATTLFATHHHDLTAVADDLPRARNLHFAAERVADGVEFDHNVAEGAATASYGVEVAREAGVPDAVVERARAVVDVGRNSGEGTSDFDDGSDSGECERDSGPSEAEPADGHRPLTAWSDAKGNGRGAANNGSGSAGDVDELRERLREIDVGNTTPVDALNILAELRERVDDE